MAKHDAESGPSQGGYGRTRVSTATACLLAEACSPALPDCRLPKGWHLDLSGVPVPPPPRSAAAHALEVARRRASLPSPLRADPKYAQNAPYWAELFKNEHESMRLSARYGEVQARWNTAKRRRIWAQAAAAAVEPEPEEPDDSGSID